MSTRRDNLLKQCEENWVKCDHSWYVVHGREWVSLDAHCKRRGLPVIRLRGEAEKLRDEILPQLQAGTYQRKPVITASTVKALATGGKTFDEAWKLYVPAMLGHIDSSEDECSYYRALASVEVPDIGPVGSMSLVQFSESIIQALFALASKGKSSNTKIKYRRALRRLFQWAAKQRHIEANPITEDTVLHTGKGNVRKQRCKPDREARLLAAADTLNVDTRERIKFLIIMAIDCALRIGELLAIRWDDVLWDEGSHGRVKIRAIEVGARKNKKPRRVPLTARVRVLLETAQASHPVAGKAWKGSDYVHGNAIGGKLTRINLAWRMCVARAEGIVIGWAKRGFDKATQRALAAIDLHFHDLRREGALRWYHDLGYGLNTIATLLGHSNLETLKVYLGIDEEDALEEAERLRAENEPGAVRGAVKEQYSGSRGRGLKLMSGGKSR